MELVRREHWGADVWEYFFLPNEPVAYLPGQYAQFSIANLTDPQGNSRIFTLTSLPSDPWLSFAVKISHKPSPYKTRLGSLKPGDTMYIGDAMGDLVAPRAATTPLLFVAGGLGIASYMALLRELGQLEQPNPVYLLWAVRSQAERYNLPVLNDLAPANRHVFVAPNRLSINDIMARATSETLIYLSGSEHFVTGLRGELHARGITDAQILFDYFSGYEDL